MGKARKSVRKFAQKHLKSTIAHRRKLKPMKNAIRRKEAALDDKRRREAKAEAGDAPKIKNVEDMNVDELMSGDFLGGANGSEQEASDSSDAEDGSDSDDLLPKDEEEEEDFVDITPEDADDDVESEDDGEGSELRTENKKFKTDIEKHKIELDRLKEKDPEFYQYLKEHDKELLDFGADDEGKEGEDLHVAEDDEQREEPQEGVDRTVLTSGRIDGWCAAVKEKPSIKIVRNFLAAYRSACHYGEGEGEDLSEQYNIKNSHVFNKVMVFMLSEIDGVFKRMLNLPSGKNITVQDFQRTGKWQKICPYVKSYLGNSLHILNEMTDNRMLAFTLRRLRPSIIFLGDLPALARKYVKAVLHFWGTGEEALPFIAFTFLRDLAMQLGTDFLESCCRGVYKQYVSNTKFINASSLPRAQFMANCVVELYGIDVALSYQNAFTFIRQMAIILRNALTMKTKDAFRKVYCWQYVASLELWVKVVSAYSSKDALGPLAYPLAQIITGVARLVPSARYFPLRMQCVVLLNKLASATGTFVPVASLLLDMLEFRELGRPPTGGPGQATDFQLVLKVPKPTAKTRAFQEECISTVLEQFAEHLSQWSCHVSFPELALVPLVQLRHFIKQTKVDRFKRQTKQLLDQIERNVEFVSRKREAVSFSPKDIELVASFLKAEKEAGSSPLSQYCSALKQRSQERKQALIRSSVEVKEPVAPIQADEGGRNEDEAAGELFNKKWLEEKRSKASEDKEGAAEEDVVEDLMLSSDDEDDPPAKKAPVSSDEDSDQEQQPEQSKKQKHKNKKRAAEPEQKKKGKLLQKHKNKKRPAAAEKKHKHAPKKKARVV